MASLTGQTIQSTYDSLLKISGNDPLTASLQRITDGLGNFTPLYLSTTAVEISSGLNVVGSITGSNLSGTNTGDETNSSIKTKLGAASGSQDGYLTSTDWSTFNAKQPALGYTPVPQTRTLTINGTTFDLSADRSWTIAAGVTSFNTRTGAITLTSGDVTGALGYTPYNATNPNAYISLTSLSASSPLSYNNTTGAFSIQQASGSQNGFLSSTDWTTFNSKQNALGYTPVPDTRTITINGTTFDLTTNRSFSVGTVTGSGTAGRIPLFATSTSLGDSQIFTATDESIGQMIGIGGTPNDAPTPHRLFVSGTSYFTNALRVNAGITATSYVISGGNNNQLVAAGGGVVTAGTNITISGGTISANNTSQWITSGSNIYYNTGNVGIGTTSPSSSVKLHVYDGSANGDVALFESNTTKSDIWIKDTNTSIGAVRLRSESNSMVFIAGGSEKVRITSGGNVGIGVSNPQNRLSLPNASYIAWQYSTGDESAGIATLSDNSMSFFQGTGERMRITSVGSVLIGGSTNPYDLAKLLVVNDSINPRTYFQRGVNLIEIFPSDGTSPNIISSSYTASGSAYMPLSISARQTNSDLYLTTNGNVGIGTTNPVELFTIRGGNIKLLSLQNSANQFRYIGTEFEASNGNNRAEIRFAIDVADTRTRISFHTANGAGTLNESVRITSGGSLCVNTAGGPVINNTTLSTRSLTTTATDRVIESYSVGFSALFYVQNNGSYFFAGSNLSDARTKKDINYLNDSVLDKVMQLKPASFKYIQNDENVKGGFIAQDVKEIFPDLVTKTQSEEDMMGVDYYGVIGILTKAIQELKQEIEELKNK